MVADAGSGFAKGDDFGVSRGIRISKVAVPASTNDLVLKDDNCSNGDFVGLEGTLGTAQGLFHPRLVIGWGRGGWGRGLAVEHSKIIVAAVWKSLGASLYFCGITSRGVSGQHGVSGEQVSGISQSQAVGNLAKVAVTLSLSYGNVLE